MLHFASLARWRVLATLAIAVVAAALSSLPAAARNVPGSAAIPLRELSVASSAQLIGGIQRGLLKARGEIREGGQASSFGATNAPEAADEGLAVSGGFVRAGDSGLVLNFEYRRIDDDDELDYDLFTGSALLFHVVRPDLMFFIGPVAESGDGETPFNSGTLESQGIGLAAGVDYRVDRNIFLTATAAFLSLDYDFTRSDGAIDGSFGALRTMLDLRADHHSERGAVVTELSLGMRYIRQDNDSYTESGGAEIESSSSDTLSAVLGGRARLLTGAVADPFVEGDLSYDLVNEFDLPGGVPEPDSERFHSRLGVGLVREAGAAMFEAGLGLHLTDEGYDGYDARLRAVIRF